MRDRAERAYLLALLGVGLLLRVAWLAELTALPWLTQHTTDAYVYDQAAQRIAAGDWLLGDAPLRMSPAYFWALGSVYATLGAGPFAMRLVQLALGVGAIALTHRLAARVLAPRAALAAAALVALAGPVIFFDAMLLPESLSLAAFVLAADALLAAAERPSPRAWVLAGLASGLAAALRPNALLPALVGVAWLAWSAERGARLRTAGAVLLGVGLAIAPITARNLAATGEPVMLTVHGGLNLWIGNGPSANGTFVVPREVPGADAPATQFEAFQRAAEEAEGHPLTAREADRYWSARTLAYAARDPLRTLALLARKLRLYVNWRDLGLVVPYAFARQCAPVLGLPLVEFGHVAALGLLAALFALFSAREPPAVRLLAALTLAHALSVIAVFVTDRYRTPHLPLLAVLAVWGIARAVEWGRARAWRPLAATAAAALLALGLAWPIGGDAHFERDWTLLADGHRDDGAFEAAHEAYRAALAIDPTYLPAEVGLARLASTEGSPEARAAWERVRARAEEAGEASLVREADRRLAPRTPPASP